MENLSRTEELLDVLLNGTELPETKPQSRIEEKLHALCEKGLGGGGSGFSPVADVKETVDGAVITITDASGTTTAIVRNGKDGKTPEKSVDYFTEEDKAEFVTSVLNALPTWQGGVY